MRGNPTIIAVIALALGCVLVVGYKLSSRMRPAAATTLPMSSCDLSVSECSAPLPHGGSLTLSVEPRPIRPLQNLSIAVRLSGQSAEKVEVDFDGAEMSMGYNRPVLSANGDHFSGQTVLPVCVTGTMKWKATVLVSKGHQRLAAPFQFEIAGR